MSSYLDSIPQAVASIVNTFAETFAEVKAEENILAMEKHVVSFTEALTIAFARALRNAEIDDAEAKAKARK